LRGIEKVVLKVEGSPTVTARAASRITETLDVRLRQNVSATADATGVFLVYCVDAPLQVDTSGWRLITIRTQRIRPFPNDNTGTFADITWQFISVAPARNVQLDDGVDQVARSCGNALAAALLAENPNLTKPSPLVSTLDLAAARVQNLAAPAIANMQARWIEESCRSHLTTEGGSSTGLVRRVAKDFRLYPAVVEGNDTILDAFGKPDSGWKSLATDADAKTAASTGSLVIGGVKSSGAYPGQLFIVVPDRPGFSTDQPLAYWGRAGSMGFGPKPVTEAVAGAPPESKNVFYFAQRISDD
jgi:hypothetical protein